jgi:hypothetical protein
MLNDMYAFFCNDESCEMLQEYETLLETGMYTFEDQLCTSVHGNATNSGGVRGDSVEGVLLSMFYSDDSMNFKERRRDRNRKCAQEARAADRLYTELMFVELGELVETLGVYCTYIAALERRSICGRAGNFEQRSSTHKTNLALLQASESDNCTAATFSATSIKERNRIHARKSRQKKSQFWQKIDKERDASLLTLKDAVEYTTALESACSFLHDFNDPVCDFAKLMEIRQRLFDRTCAHHDKCKEMSSRLAFRATYRDNFKF